MLSFEANSQPRARVLQCTLYFMTSSVDFACTELDGPEQMRGRTYTLYLGRTYWKQTGKGRKQIRGAWLPWYACMTALARSNKSICILTSHEMNVEQTVEEQRREGEVRVEVRQQRDVSSH